MEEELNENELEERLYAMFHHVDETQNNLSDRQQNKFDALQLTENGPRSTMRRYWRTEPDASPNPYYKSNIETKDPAPAPVAQIIPADTLKHEKSPPNPPSPVELSIFQLPVPLNAKKTIEFLDHEQENPVVLQSSDEDEVVEVALLPNPTITIESSDEDELQIVKPKSRPKADLKPNSGDRAVSSSPVPSVVSSVSDEFIRSDCIALNISSRHPDKHSFDFSLHGSDLLGQNANKSSKKMKRKKNNEAVTSTPINAATAKPTDIAETCFATPKSKAKNKKQRTKLLEKKKTSLKADLYDSDSNLSSVDTSKNKNLYVVTEKSLPSVDVYESDSNQSEIVKDVNTDQPKVKNLIETCSSDSNDNVQAEPPRSSQKLLPEPDSESETVDLTDLDNYITIDTTGISESIVIGNVTGLSESLNYGKEEIAPSCKSDISKYVSSKEPSILKEDLDFDNLKGKEKICMKRRYSLTTLRAEMEKFYNESWGGEDFNHKEIQKNMSRDKSLWAIDPKDRFQSIAQRKIRCSYCNRIGHRDDTCRQKPPVCHMCGNMGHYEPRCPSKICVNCGAPNFMYSTMCGNCSSWTHMRCAECGQIGHPASHCPDLWRRYHNTVSLDQPLDKCNESKKTYQLFCSGCARRGHLIHTCRNTLPFSSLPINSPFVSMYRPLYNNYSSMTVRSKMYSESERPKDPRNAYNKRFSKSPTVHETHQAKKQNTSTENRDDNKTQNVQKIPPKEDDSVSNKRKSLDSAAPVSTAEKASEQTTTKSSNHDDKGRVIQDNEVSDTSDVVNSARIYITNDIVNMLKTQDGKDWLQATMSKLQVKVTSADMSSFLSIRGKLADQERFQAELREWVEANTYTPKVYKVDLEESELKSILSNMPKNRNNLLRKLSKGLDSLNGELGDPQSLYNELTYSQNQHEKLMKQKVISPEKLSNSRTRINDVLKKLNAILLGQAELGGGKEHLYELKNYRQMLMRSRSKNIPPYVRSSIGTHYNSIFAPVARNDYTELLSKYYVAKTKKLPAVTPAKMSEKKKKGKPVKPVPGTSSVKPSIPSHRNEIISTPAATPNAKPSLVKGVSVYGSDSDQITKLTYLRDKLNMVKKSSLKSSLSKETKFEMLFLQRRLEQYILMLTNDKSVTSKSAKKIRKLQENTREFLSKML